MNWGIFGRTRAAEKPPSTPREGSAGTRMSDMLSAIDDGVAASGLPTLVCRKCGLKYHNTGTFLHGAACPDCTATGG